MTWRVRISPLAHSDGTVAFLVLQVIEYARVRGAGGGDAAEVATRSAEAARTAWRECKERISAAPWFGMTALKDCEDTLGVGNVIDGSEFLHMVCSSLRCSAWSRRGDPRSTSWTRTHPNGEMQCCAWPPRPSTMSWCRI